MHPVASAVVNGSGRIVLNGAQTGKGKKTPKEADVTLSAKHPALCGGDNVHWCHSGVPIVC